MACNFSGWIPAALISQVAQSSQKPSTQCFAGTRIRPDVTYIYLIFQATPPKILNLSMKVGGLPAVGHFKSFLPQNLSSSFPWSGIGLVINLQWLKKSKLLLRFPSKLSMEPTCLFLVLMKECLGRTS